jgi:hypothetical protein
VRLLLRLLVACAACAPCALSACAPTPPPLASCRGDLGGVWLARADGPVPGATPLTGDERLAFDLRDERAGLALYPLWDSSRFEASATKSATHLRSPWRIRLTRAGDAAVGTLAFRDVQGGHVCTIEQPARLSGCHNQDAVLVLDLVEKVDPSTCAVLSAPSRRTFTLSRR